MADSSQKHALGGGHGGPNAAKRQKKVHGPSQTRSLTMRGRERKKLKHNDYAIGIICALEFEMSAVRYMLDVEHSDFDSQPGDSNMYVLGELCGHNVVIACLPGNQGKGAAAIVATNMARTFPNVNLRLLVGIGGGIPSDAHDIRLGDVVISMPDDAHGGVIQYDLYKDLDDGVSPKGFLTPTPSILRSAAIKMRSDHRSRLNRIDEFLSDMLEKGGSLSAYKRPELDDILFKPEYPHVTDQRSCGKCNRRKVVKRGSRSSTCPEIHYGLIASGDRLMRSTKKANEIRQRIGDVLCFEMEAAGILTDYPCLVIRGISDYADSHKNNEWQHYAAAAAAGCVKELLTNVSSHIQAVRTDFDEEADSDLQLGPQEGDRVAYASHPRPLTHGKLKKLQASLYFGEIDKRRSNITKEHARTCQWLLESPKFIQWLNDAEIAHHHGVLWIKGKPGAGKSTLMNFALTHARSQMDGKVHLSFFFHARGVELEKSTLGMYRALLWQLLHTFPRILDECKCLALSVWESSDDYQWSVPSLQELLRYALANLGSTSLVLFIDALDECEEQDIRDMLDFFEDIGDCAVKNGTTLRTLFSSRRYPNITVKYGLEMLLDREEGHSEDIFIYVKSKLMIGDSEIASQIRRELHDKASGVFMWVCLVVNILNTAFDHGPIQHLQQKLREIPNDLHELFHNILTRDENRRDELLLLIQWILFARKPLTPLQLYSVLSFRNDRENLSNAIFCPIKGEDINKYILSRSKGLAEVTVSDIPTVQFIHESVRDFFLKDRGFVKVWRQMETNVTGRSHERLRECCYDYMRIAAPVLEVSDLQQTLAREADVIRSEAMEKHPFLEYAILNLLFHADVAQAHGVSQQCFLSQFDISTWNELNNIFERYSVRRHSAAVSLQYILAEYNYANLIKVCPGGLKWVNIEEERYGLPLFAAVAAEAKAAVAAILEVYAERMDLRTPFRDIHRRYIASMARVRWPGRRFEISRSRDIPSHARKLGNEALFTFVDEASNAMRADHAANYQKTAALLQAAQNGLSDEVRMLLADDELNINVPDALGRTPLCCAASMGHAATVRELLADGRAEPTRLDKSDREPIADAAINGHEGVVKLLLADSRVDPNAQDRIQQTALCKACYQGHEAVVQELLVDKRIDPNIPDYANMTPLHIAVEMGEKTVVRLLLADSRVNPTLQDIRGRTSLHIAARYNRETLVRLLLADPRIDPNIVDKKHHTALHIAALWDSETAVSLLLADPRVDPALLTIGQHTALWLAVKWSGIETVKLLLGDRRIDPNEADNLGSTPLSIARVQHNQKLIELLLSDKRVDR
ncbi:hypothetical protein BJX64DRAFT_48158 [Aspergillus heterothallicus]